MWMRLVRIFVIIIIIIIQPRLIGAAVRNATLRHQMATPGATLAFPFCG